MEKKYVNLHEAAELLDTTVDEVKSLREAGELRGFADRGTWKFRRDVVEELRRARGGGSDPEVPILDESGPDASDTVGSTESPGAAEPADEDFELAPAAGESKDSSISSGDDSGIFADQASDGGIPLEESSPETGTGSSLVLEGGDSGIALDDLEDGDESGLALEPADGESDIALASDDTGIALDEGDSGIALETGDSGIALDEGGSGIALETGDSGIALEAGDSHVEPATPEGARAETPASPFDSETELSGEDENVLTMDDEEDDPVSPTAAYTGAELEEVDFDVSSEDELEVGGEFEEEAFADDEFADDEFEDDEFGEASFEEEVFEEAEDEPLLGAEAAAPARKRGAPPGWGADALAGLALTAVLMIATALVTWQSMRQMWTTDVPETPLDGVVSALADMIP